MALKGLMGMLLMVLRWGLMIKELMVEGLLKSRAVVDWRVKLIWMILLACIEGCLFMVVECSLTILNCGPLIILRFHLPFKPEVLILIISNNRPLLSTRIV
jgi:hypothetical protein